MDTVQITKEQAEKLFTDLIKGLMNCHQKGEWISATANITAGPKEGPIMVLCFAPGTNKETALGIQNDVSAALLKRNGGCK